MTSTTVTLSYHNYDMRAVQIDGILWVRGHQLDAPLGYEHERSVSNLFTRNEDEFTDEETRIVPLATDGGVQEVRVFSLRGARLLALFAKTTEAKAFRRWVLDVLDGKVLRRGIPALVARAGAIPLSLDARLALTHAVQLLETEQASMVRERLQGILTGDYTLPSDPRLAAHAEAWERANELQRISSREQARIRRMAALDGWSETAIKAELSRRKRLGQSQREITFGDDAAESDETAEGAGDASS